MERETPRLSIVVDNASVSRPIREWYYGEVTDDELSAIYRDMINADDIDQVDAVEAEFRTRGLYPLTLNPVQK